MSSAVNTPATTDCHYDANYFKRQSSPGNLLGSLNAEKFSSFIKPTDAILDFGCGGGFLLSSLNAERKLGIDVNVHARSFAESLGIATVATLDEAPNDSFDVVISHHALEHTEAPLDVVRSLKAKVKPGGLAVVVVPSERYDTAYRRENTEQHLYTWSAVNLGNLFSRAGFEVVAVTRIAHRWPPRIDVIDRMFGRPLCNLICKLHGLLRPKLTQIRIVAKRPLSGMAIE